MTSACICALSGVTRRKQHRPGIASNDNTMHVPTARSSADLTNPNQTPTRYTHAKGRIFLQMATPQAASSQRTHVSRTQGRGRVHPVNRRVTTQYLHTQSVTTRRRCRRIGNHEAPLELLPHRVIGIAADQVESKVSGAARGGGGWVGCGSEALGRGVEGGQFMVRGG